MTAQLKSSLLLLTLMANGALADKPNILLILADDLGYADLSSFRDDNPWINHKPAPEDVSPPMTPALDRLAAEGRKLTAFYTNCSVCSPTRAALLTGKYNHRTGVVNVLGQLGEAMRRITPEEEPVFAGLPLEEVTLAEILKDNGYTTACFGKWHLGDLDNYHPMDQGFDQYVGCEAWAGDNFALKNSDGNSYFYRGRKLVEAPGYWYTDVLADETIAFIDKNRNQPFFAYLALTAPHLPLIGPNDLELSETWDENKGSHLGPRTDLHQAYKEVVEGMDAAVGRVLQFLRDNDIEENTLIIFASDNGPVDYGSCAPFRGRKTWLYEGGTRVPTIVKWKGKIPEGSSSDAPSMTMDILPTLVSIAGITLQEDLTIDGIDVTKAWFTGRDLPARKLYWEKPTGVHMKFFDVRRWAVQHGDWKLTQPRSGKPLELYNLKSDPRETTNLADNNPELVGRLHSDFEAWKKDVYADCPYDLEKVIQQLKDHGSYGRTN